MYGTWKKKKSLFKSRTEPVYAYRLKTSTIKSRASIPLPV